MRAPAVVRRFTDPERDAEEREQLRIRRRYAEEDAALEQRRRDQMQAEHAQTQRRWSSWYQERHDAAERRREAERQASDAERVKRERIAAAQQAAQAAWARERDEIRARVAELRSLLADAQSRVETAPLPDATAAASEVRVYETRLAAAENEFAQHMARQPRWFA